MEKRSPTILVVDDESAMLEAYKELLVGSEYSVLTASRGIEALVKFHQEKVDLVTLDIMMPDLDGLEVLRRIRKSDKEVAVIMTTAMNMARPAIDSMKMGIHAYITKPFDINEMTRNIDEALREVECRRRRHEAIIKYGGLLIDLARRSVSVKDKPVELTDTEYELLLALVRNADRYVSRETVCELIGESGNYAGCRELDKRVRSLAGKLGKIGDAITVTEEGYRFEGTLDNGTGDIL